MTDETPECGECGGTLFHLNEQGHCPICSDRIARLFKQGLLLPRRRKTTTTREEQ